jgi:energy-coupling factor transport system permease protein
MNSFNVTISQYVKGESYLHKLDPRFKILATIILMISIFLIPSSLVNVYYLLGFIGLFVALLLLAKINVLAVLKGLQPVLVIGLFTFVLQVIYNPTGSLVANIEFQFSLISILVAVLILAFWFLTSKYVPFKGIYTILMLFGVVASFLLIKTDLVFGVLPFDIYSDGLIAGLFFVLRIVLIIMLTSILTMTTSTTDINLGLEWLMYPLRLIKVPVSEIAMMLSLTLRFIPTLLIETDKIMKAQASRGIDFNEGNFFEKIKQIVTLLIPMFFISITRAEDLSNAMEARGYIIGAKRTSVDELKFNFKDVLGFIFISLILVFTILIKVF